MATSQERDVTDCAQHVIIHSSHHSGGIDGVLPDECVASAPGLWTDYFRRPVKVPREPVKFPERRV